MALITRVLDIELSSCCVDLPTNEESSVVDIVDHMALNAAVDVILSDGVVGMPTETVFGLAANALSCTAVRKIFQAKNRPSDNPLIVHCSSVAMIEEFCTDEPIPAVYRDIIKRHWPGPLTILLSRGSCIPDIVAGGSHRTTVAVRIPSHPIARALIHKCGVPLAAPSANTSGRPSPTLASHVLHDMNGLIPLILSPVENYMPVLCENGVESTVLDGLQSPPIILRPGGVTVDMIRCIKVFEDVIVYNSSNHSVPTQETTPGMKYRHYSPSVPVILLRHQKFNIDAILLDATEYAYSHVGIISHDTVSKPDNCDYAIQTSQLIHGDNTVKVTKLSLAKSELMGKYLFYAVRLLDEDWKVDAIYIQNVSDKGSGMAVMNRLEKAASRSLKSVGD